MNPEDPKPGELRRDAFSDTPTADTPASPDTPALAPGLGPSAQRAGYRLIRQLGQGGMGAVFEAQQDKPSRRVALKLIHADRVDQRMLRRFDLESEALARLSHPAIAQVFEVGLFPRAGGHPEPFIAMELISGTTLDRHIAEQSPSLTRRLALFIAVCEGVEHAHQRGVIHRDLKPSNILVGDGERPKILDFGIARLTGADSAEATLRTEVGQIVGTIPYMSPEQASGDPTRLDTRTDVYSLGVVLYELLTGRLPIEVVGLPLIEAVRRVRDAEPTDPRLPAPRLPADLCTIVLKALEKDPTRRYQSARELAEDLRRFERDEPVLARKPTAAYQLAKFARRNRTLVTAATLVLVTLAGGLVATVWQLRRALHAEGEQRKATEAAQVSAAAATESAHQEAEARADADAVNQLLIDAIRAAKPEEGGRGMTVVDLLDSSAPLIDKAFANLPGRRIKLHDTFGEVYRALNVHDRSAHHLASALELAKAHRPGDAALISSIAGRLATASMDLGELSRARDAIEMADRPDAPLEDRAFAAADRGKLAHNLGDTDAAEFEYARCVRWLAQADPEHPELGPALDLFGRLLIDQGRLKDAAWALRESAVRIEREAPAPSKLAAMSLLTHAYLDAAMGRWADAQGRAAQAREMYASIHADPTAASVRLAGMELHGIEEDAPPGTLSRRLSRDDDAPERVELGGMAGVQAVSLRNRARLLARAGRDADARARFERSLAIRGGEEALIHAHTLTVRAQAALDAGHPAAAAADFTRAIGLWASVGAGATPWASLGLARAILARGSSTEVGEAERRAREALDARVRTLGADAWPAAVAREVAAQAALAQGRDLAQELSEARRVLAGREAVSALLGSDAP